MLCHILKKGHAPSFVVAIVIVIVAMMRMHNTLAFRLLPIQCSPSTATTRTTTTTTTSTTLHMGGFNKRKKKAQMLKKYTDDKKNEADMTPDEIKERNDRRRFEDLLNSESATSSRMSELAGETTYLTTAQEEEEMNASFSRMDRLFEGDPAPTLPFEGLVNVKSDKNIGKGGTENLLPWLKKNPSQTDYVICISDPREKSAEFRNLMKTLPMQLQGEKILFMTSDTPAETRRWMKKNQIDSIRVYSDEKLEWMREYSALGEKRGAMCMFILADGKVQKVIRELDVDLAERAVSNAIKALSL